MHVSVIQAAVAMFRPGCFAHVGLAAWRPLLDPLPVDNYWLLLMLPMAVAIAVVYKAVKIDHLSALPRQAIWLAVQFVIVMVAAAVVLWLVTEIV